MSHGRTWTASGWQHGKKVIGRWAARGYTPEDAARDFIDMKIMADGRADGPDGALWSVLVETAIPGCGGEIVGDFVFWCRNEDANIVYLLDEKPIPSGSPSPADVASDPSFGRVRSATEGSKDTITNPIRSEPPAQPSVTGDPSHGRVRSAMEGLRSVRALVESIWADVGAIDSAIVDGAKFDGGTSLSETELEHARGMYPTAGAQAAEVLRMCQRLGFGFVLQHASAWWAKANWGNENMAEWLEGLASEVRAGFVPYSIYLAVVDHGADPKKDA